MPSSAVALSFLTSQQLKKEGVSTTAVGKKGGEEVAQNDAVKIEVGCKMGYVYLKLAIFEHKCVNMIL